MNGGRGTLSSGHGSSVLSSSSSLWPLVFGLSFGSSAIIGAPYPSVFQRGSPRLMNIRSNMGRSRALYIYLDYSSCQINRIINTTFYPILLVKFNFHYFYLKSEIKPFIKLQNSNYWRDYILRIGSESTNFCNKKIQYKSIRPNTVIGSPLLVFS